MYPNTFDSYTNAELSYQSNAAERSSELIMKALFIQNSEPEMFSHLNI